MDIEGKLNVDQLKQAIEKGQIETVIFGFIDHYGRLLGKRFDADFFIESGLEEGTHCCDYLLTTDMEMEPVQGFESANWELGYGDFHLHPDLNTIRVATWLEKTVIVIGDLDEAIAPRTILKRQVETAGDLGFRSMGASELEHYLYLNSYSDFDSLKFDQMTAASQYLEDYHILQGSRRESYTGTVRKHLKKSGIPVENSKGEWGRGQHEINVRYAEILEMADRHVVFKQCLKEIADQMGCAVTFMAKVDENQAGSSCHIHLSLWKDGKNAFVGDKELGPVKCSNIFKWFLGGWIKYVPDVMPFYAPTVNSYKRYRDGSWAPTRLAWSYDNRTAGFRVVGEGESLRIECRIPGADCNPYLAFAASLACGLHGVQEEIAPPDIFEGDIYAANELPRVPYTLKEANESFRKSDFAQSVFGKDVVAHYAHHFDMEVKAFEKAVTDWERRRYFERI
ncbi:glutamine synthetase family protein [Portibacter marinus]|uniref:glutamine synthetase family protein n=1 Tax=Portibacter marinus TaxID=2898660 RepID=UPI001F3015AA|nr:glutamine synthetase family protein [Portibacter marinus]